MMDFLVRSKMLIGNDNIDKLKNVKIAVFGLGGVGSFAAEALARCGIGSFKLIDNDVVDISNKNRQLIALDSTIGKDKTQVMAERIKDINKDVKIEIFNKFYLNKDDVDISDCDYVVDAIDTITGKIAIIEECNSRKIKVISAMGCGNRIKPQMLEITDLYSTKGCPLSKVMRHELKKRGIYKLKVVYSTETPLEKHEIDDPSLNSMPKDKLMRLPASISFVPSTAGLLIASEVINDLIEI